MNPAFSVIFLTTLIGVGQGLFLALFTAQSYSMFGLLPVQDGETFYAYGSLLALLFLGGGLLASFFHLGHPERAWRSASQWRTSWLSREVIVLPAFMGTVLLYGLAHLFGWKPEARRMDYYERLLWNVRAGTQSADGMFMYYVPTVAGGWKTFGEQYDSNWCCTGTGIEEYSKLVDTIYFQDENSVYVNQFVASEVNWQQKRVRLVQHTGFPEEERTSITVNADKPVAFALKVRAPHWAQGIAVSVNGRPEKTLAGSDGYLVLDRTWKSGDRVEVSLPMTLRQEPVAGSPELATLAYGPLALACLMGRDGLSRNLIDGTALPDLDRLPPLPMPSFEAGPESSRPAKATPSWAKKTDEGELRFRTVAQAQDLELKPLYQVMDQRYSVYWKKARKA